MRIVGIDPSLSCTGVSDGRQHLAVRTSSDHRIEERLRTISWMVRRFADAVADAADLAVIEWSSYNSPGKGEELAALRYMIRVELWRCGIPVVVVPPATLKLYTAGNGVATKQEMAVQVLYRYGVDVSGYTVAGGRYDIADAVALAAIGYARVGQPLGPAARPEAANRLAWPELLSED